MSALARLKALRSGGKLKAFTENAPTKPTEPPFVGSVGGFSEMQPNICTQDAAPENPAITRELDADGFIHWLRDEGLCLVLRGGVLIFTGPNTQGTGEPSAALRQHAELHKKAITALLASSQDFWRANRTDQCAATRQHQDL